MNRNKQGKKWTLGEHWNRASKAKRISWFVTGAGLLVGGCVFCVYVAQYRQAKLFFWLEHRPRIIFSRPLEFRGAFFCDAGKNPVATGYHGRIRVWLKNIRSTDASGTIPAPPMLRLIPSQKTGDKFLDDRVLITTKMCEGGPEPPNTAYFPINGGQEVVEEFGSGGGASYTGRISFSNTTVFQLYVPVCIWYYSSDERVRWYGTCETYRFNAGGRYDFTCSETPISGTFERTVGGYCQN